MQILESAIILTRIENITNISAQTINPDESGNPVYTKVEKAQIFRKKVKRYSDVIFTFPNIKKGSIIEYKYVDNANDLYALRNWYFQKSVPVKFSSYIMNFPNELEIRALKGALKWIERKDDGQQLFPPWGSFLKKYFCYMKLLFTVLCFFALHDLLAQKGLPAFGKIDRADLELTDCAFDPGAAAFKLIDQGKLYYTRNSNDFFPFTTMYERRLRIKILKEPGLSYANIAIPVYSYHANEKMLKVEACTYNLVHGSIKKTMVEKKAIFNRRLNKHFSETVIVFPEANVGSIIEYKYLVQRKSIADVKDWYFQSDLPCRYSEYQLSTPSLLHFIVKPVTVDSLETMENYYTQRTLIRDSVVSNATFHKTFIMRNLTAISPEPFTGSVKDYQQRLSFHLAEIDYGNGNLINVRSDWQDVASELLADPDLGMQLLKKIPAATSIVNEAKRITGTESQLVFIYNWIKNNIQWNGQESIYSFAGIARVFEQKSGSSGDINLLLISLLKHAGINAIPILFSTRDNGLVNTALPAARQFNTVMAFVGDRTNYLLLDATMRFSDHRLVPVKILNTKGFILGETEDPWLECSDTTNNFSLTTAMRGEIGANDQISGDVLITAAGYAASQLTEESVNDGKKFTENFSTLSGNHTSLTGLEKSDYKPGALPLELTFKYNASLSQTGAMRYFKLLRFSGFEKNPFLGLKRRTDIDFGYRQSQLIYGSYTIPANYSFDSLPENILLIMPDTSIVFRRFITTENNALNVTMSIEFRRSYFTAGEYPELSNFYRLLFTKMNEQIIINKKANP